MHNEAIISLLHVVLFVFSLLLFDNAISSHEVLSTITY
jgi:hypothetical protein